MDLGPTAVRRKSKRQATQSIRLSEFNATTLTNHLQQVDREAVAQSVRPDPLGDVSGPGRLAQGHWRKRQGSEGVVRTMIMAVIAKQSFLRARDCDALVSNCFGAAMAGSRRTARTPGTPTASSGA